ncbi:MAG: DNA polymerase III subunit delta' [Gammaproteobacteria bacterium]|nr:DNA polymerase III subunit delta' [Gammaproteobacteria bacterium]
MALIDALLPWQTASWAGLAQALNQGRLPHGILLHGPAGIGKERLALTLAERLMCAEAIGEALACGRCKSCQLMASGTHPDFQRVAPEEGKKQIGIAQVRELRERLAQTAQQGRWRVAVLAPADAMNVNSANALLKTLEEPGADTVLILVTARLSAVPITVRSRCRLLAQALPVREQSAAWLRDQGLDSEALDAALAEEPAPLRALDLVTSGALAARREWVAAFEALASGRAEPVSSANRLGTASLSEILVCFQRFLAQRARAGIAGAGELRFAERLAEAKALSQSTANVNGLLILESLFTVWFELQSKLRHSK